MGMQGEGLQDYSPTWIISFGKSFCRQFDLAMQLRKEELKKVEAEVSEVTKKDIISVFVVTKDHMLEVAKNLETEWKTENLGWPSAWLPSHYGPTNYGKSVDKDNKEVLFIQTGSTKGTTFKINVGGLVFSSLFDTGTQVSCIKYDAMATLCLLGKISDNNINVRTANGQDMDIKGSSYGQFQNWTM